MKPLDPFLKYSLQLAERARANGNHPFGALLVYQGQVIATAENTVISDQDITAHAEMNLIRKAFKDLPRQNLKSTVLYSNTEPCAMCSGAIYWAGIGSVVFGCSNRTLSEIVGGSLEIPCREILRHGKKVHKIIGPVNENHFKKIHEEFWIADEEAGNVDFLQRS